jgi:hypothetical protein
VVDTTPAEGSRDVDLVESVRRRRPDRLDQEALRMAHEGTLRVDVPVEVAQTLSVSLGAYLLIFEDLLVV